MRLNRKKLREKEEKKEAKKREQEERKRKIEEKKREKKNKTPATKKRKVAKAKKDGRQWREELSVTLDQENENTCKLCLGPVQTPLHSCAEPNLIKVDFRATLERRLVQTAYLCRT